LEDQDNKNIYDILYKLLNIIGTILSIPIILIVIFAVTYLVATFNDLQAATEIKSMMISLWQNLLPIIYKSLSILWPILVLIISIGLIKWFIAKKSEINFLTLKDNLTTILALTVILSICILPFTGMEVPSSLSNIALIIIGFYFGKQGK
jgi:hypothetical protein